MNASGISVGPMDDHTLDMLKSIEEKSKKEETSQILSNKSNNINKKGYAFIGDRGKHVGDSSLRSKQSQVRTGSVTK